MRTLRPFPRLFLVPPRRRVQLRGFQVFFLLIALSAMRSPVHAARLLSVDILDRDFLVVHLNDGDVTPNESGGVDTVTRYNPPLSTSAAVQTR